MDFTKGNAMQLDTAFALSHFAAVSAATVISAIHRGKPVDDKMVQHLLKTLATAAASSPVETKAYFDQVAEALAGKHYPPS